jgi:hypothetical protein
MRNLGERCEICTHHSRGECYAATRQALLREIIEELAQMDCSLSARDAAVDLRQSYADELAKDWG